MDTLKRTFHGLICALVNSPDLVSVEYEDLGTIAVFHIEVAETDMGKVIGKQGRTVRALRTIANAVGPLHGKVIALDVTSGSRAASQLAKT